MVKTKHSAVLFVQNRIILTEPEPPCPAPAHGELPEIGVTASKSVQDAVEFGVPALIPVHWAEINSAVKRDIINRDSCNTFLIFKSLKINRHTYLISKKNKWYNYFGS